MTIIVLTLKKLISFIKHRKTDLINVAPLKDNGILKDSPQDKAEIQPKQFSCVFSTDGPSDFPNLRPWQKICTSQISVNGVLKLLNNLNIHIAMGLDVLHPRILKQLAPTIGPMLQLIFQKSVDSGQVPYDWKTVNVCPIFKKGQKYDPVNYRPRLRYFFSCLPKWQVKENLHMPKSDTACQRFVRKE